MARPMTPLLRDRTVADLPSHHSRALSSWCFAHLILGPGEPVRLEFYTPAGLLRDRHVSALDSIGVVAKEPVLPRIIVGTLDGELEVLARVRQRAQHVHGEQGDEAQVGRVGRYREAMLAGHARYAQDAIDTPHV